MLRFCTAVVTMIMLLPPAIAQETPGVVPSDVVDLSGTVAAAREAELSPSFPGLLKKINFIPGQIVKEGDVLFEFEATGKQLELDRARAGLQRSEAQLRLAELTWKNQQTLKARGATSDRQLFEAEVAKEIADAAVKEARVLVQGGEIALAETKLRAPFAGIMGSVLVREGTYIAQSARTESTLAVITQLDPVLVLVDVPYEVFRARRGLRLVDPDAVGRFTINLVLPNGEQFPHAGKMTGGGHEFDPKTQALKVVAEFPNPELMLRPGLAVTVKSGIMP